MYCFPLLMEKKVVFSISFVWVSKMLEDIFIWFDFWFCWHDIYFNLFFIHCNCLECKTLVAFHISIRTENLTLEWHTHTHKHTHVHEHTDVCGYEQFNLSTMTFHTQSHISNVMCQKINNPYMSSVCRYYVWVWVSVCVV